MKKHQRGEVMVAVMVVMLIAIWLGGGRTAMMGAGHGVDPAMKPSQAEQQMKVEPSSKASPEDLKDHRN